MKKISILFLILLCNCTFLYAQQFSITGVVTDKKLKEPIIGASVIVKGTTNGTVTDLDGKFTIQASKSSVLIVSFIGYTPQEFTINGNQTFYQISLAEDTQTLDEVVVVGFGTQKKVNLTGAVATVDKKTLESRPVTSVSQALQGVMPGLNIDMNDKGGGIPGRRTAVFLIPESRDPPGRPRQRPRPRRQDRSRLRPLRCGFPLPRPHNPPPSRRR